MPPFPTQITLLGDDPYPGLGRYVWHVARDDVAWSNGLLRIHGRKTAPRLHADAMDVLHPDDRAEIRAKTQAALTGTATSLAHSYRIQHPDGTLRHVVDQARIDRDANGRATEIHGVVMDVTDAQPAAMQSGAPNQPDALDLLENEGRLALAQDITGIGVWDVNLVDGHTVWTPGLYKLLQIDPATPPSPELFFDLIHPDDIDRVRAEFDVAVKTKSQFLSEFRILRPSGELRYISGKGRVTAEHNGTPTRVIGINYDITDRKLAENHLRYTEARLRLILDETPALVGIVDLDGILREANRVALEAGGLEHGQVIGRPFYDAPWWTHDPKEVARLKDAITQAKGGKHVRYDATIKAATGELRTIDFILSPVLDNEGQVVLLVPSALDITDRKATERRLAKSEARFRALFNSINAGFCAVEVRLDAPDGRVDYRVIEANPAFFEQTGFPEAILGRWLREALPDLEEYWFDIYGEVARTGTPKRFEEHAKMLNRWFDVYAFPIDAPEDNHVAILFHDISDRKQHEDHVDLLLKEVNHRAKNVLSLVNVIARRTFSTGSEGFIERFTDRIAALAANQDILVSSEWTTVDLNDLVRGQLGHFKDLFDHRIHTKGPPLLVFPEAAEKIGMALHELTTNAGKYGALSNNTGHVHISWHVKYDTPHVYVLEWQEQGGPPVTAPDRKGFGSLISGSVLAAGLDGTVDADYRATGLAWRLECPLSSVAAAEAEADQTAQHIPKADENTGTGVLVVDDDALLALSITELLTDAGLTVIGPSGDAASALALMDRTRPAFAILDVNLGKETSEPIALELRRRGVPFLCVSGYASNQLPLAFTDAPFLSKPVDEQQILSIIRSQADLPASAL